MGSSAGVRGEPEIPSTLPSAFAPQMNELVMANFTSSLGQNEASRIRDLEGVPVSMALGLKVCLYKYFSCGEWSSALSLTEILEDNGNSALWLFSDGNSSFTAQTLKTPQPFSLLVPELMHWDRLPGSWLPILFATASLKKTPSIS